MNGHKQLQETSIKSTHFLLPRHQPENNESEEAYARRLSDIVRIQINQTNVDEIEIAEDLVQVCKKLSRPLALHILYDATKNSPFKLAGARAVILRGIDEEDMARSPLNTSERTCAFIKRYQIQHPEEVDFFLRNPGRLLFWLENASSLEIARVFSHYFKSEKEDSTAQKEYSIHMCQLAEMEIQTQKPGKAVICYALMRRGPIVEKGQPQVSAAIEAIEAAEPGKFTRMLTSARVKLNASHEQITQADNCFVSAAKQHFAKAVFKNLRLDGARFNACVFDHANFVDASLVGAELQFTSFFSADCTNARMQGANLYSAQLGHGCFIQADMRGTNLARANLTNADLYGASLHKANLEETNLTDTNFFSRSLFKFPEAVDSEFNRLASMLKDHAYFSVLQEAILKSFLRHMDSPSIAEDTAIRLLERAYAHPLFNQNAQSNMLKSIANTAAAVLPISITGYFWRRPEGTQAAQPYETRAQEDIRVMLAKYKNCLVAPADIRPLPPRAAPAEPVQQLSSVNSLR